MVVVLPGPYVHHVALLRRLLKALTWRLGTFLKFRRSPSTAPTDALRNPTAFPRSRPDEGPEANAINARSGLSGSPDANNIASNGEEISCSCLGVMGVSMVKFAWIRRVVVGLGGRSPKDGRQ